MNIEWGTIIKLINGTTTEIEKRQINEWASKSRSRQKFLKDAITFYSSEIETKDSFGDVNNAWRKVNPIVKSRKRYIKFTIPVAAASILLLFSTLLYNNYLENNSSLPVIEPGQEKATLVLADGRAINLNSNLDKLPSNVPAKQKVENKKTTLSIDIINRSSTEIPEKTYNQIVVPKYAEYQINLADGTKVWLNSETEIKFPLVFGETERTVYVTGEAYFKVAHNPEKPFVVHINENTSVKALGTEFNIRTYDSTNFQSTLIEGSIELNHEGNITKITPGKSCNLDLLSGKTSVFEVDILSIVAWKNGEFIFRNERLEKIIDELSRWYKIDVQFENESAKNERFYLYFNRSTGFREIMQKLDKTGKIKYRYNNKTITIS